MTPLDIATFLAFLSIAGSVLLLFQAVSLARSDRVLARLVDPAQPAFDPWSEWTESLAAQLPRPVGAYDRLRNDLRRAGYHNPRTLKRYLAVRNLAMFAALLGGLALAVAAGPQRMALGLQFCLAGLMLAGLCWAIPRLIVRNRGRLRAIRIRDALPDALDMLGMSLSGGLSLRDALQHVGDSLAAPYPDLAFELGIVARQAELGTLDEALRDFATRIDVDDVVSLNAMLLQSQRLGTDVIAAVRNFADLMREKRRQDLDERSSRISVYVLFPIILCLVPAVWILLWGPAVLDLVDFFRDFTVPATTGQ